MHIVLFSENDWSDLAQGLSLPADRVTQVRGSIADLADRVLEKNPDLVIAAVPDQSHEVIHAFETLGALAPACALVPVCATPAPDFLMRLMRAGIREVLPVADAATVVDLVERLRSRVQRGVEKKEDRARRVGFMSAKGGDGGTCVAANMAAALAKDHDVRVLLIDLSLPFGDVEMYLSSQQPGHDLADFSDEVNRLDLSLVESMVMPVAENFHVITSPTSFEKVLKISPAQVEKLIDVVSKFYNFVVIDLGAGVDPVSLRALEKLDQLVVIATITVPSVRRANQILRLWEGLGLALAKVSVVVNRHTVNPDIQIADFEKASGKRVAMLIPNQSAGVSESLLKGLPLVTLQPNSDFSRVIFSWAAEWLGKPAQEKSIWHRFGIK